MALKEEDVVTKDETDQEITEEEFEEIDKTDIDRLSDYKFRDVFEYIHEGIEVPDDYAMDLYKKYLQQRWDVYDLDFSQDREDWENHLTEKEKDAFMRVSSGFHHGERQVEVDLEPLMTALPRDEQKVFMSSQIEDEARHTVFYDRFYTEGAGIESDNIMDTLDETFDQTSGAFDPLFGLEAHLGEQVQRKPHDPERLTEFLTCYQLYVEGVGALSTMQLTLDFCREMDKLPGFYKGFLATCRDEARHVRFGTNVLKELVQEDPSLVNNIHKTLKTILSFVPVGAANPLPFEDIGTTREEAQENQKEQLLRAVNLVGIELTEELEEMIYQMEPGASGG